MHRGRNALWRILPSLHWVALELTIAIEPVVALCPQDDCGA